MQKITKSQLKLIKEFFISRFKSKCSKQSVNNNTENKNSKSIIKSTVSRGLHDNKVKSCEKDPKPAWGPTSSIVSDE